jgi:hypothetical protein
VHVIHNLVPELDELSREVVSASELRGGEERLAQLVQRHAALLAGREGEGFRAAGVPGADKLFASVANGDTDASVNLLRNWDRWQRYLREELVVDRMLDAVAECVVVAERPTRFDHRRPESRRETGPVIPEFSGEAHFEIDGDHNLRIVLLNTDRPATKVIVKSANGVRDTPAIQLLQYDAAFTIALKAFTMQHRKLATLYDTLVSSPDNSDDRREHLNHEAEHHRSVSNEINPRTEVDEETIKTLESLAGEVQHLRREEVSVRGEIDSQAARLAAKIRASLDTGETTVNLARDYAIQTVTEPSDPEPAARGLRRLPIVGRWSKGPERPEPRQRRVVVDLARECTPVEPVPWLRRDQSVANKFVGRSAQMLTQMQGRGPVVAG